MDAFVTACQLPAARQVVRDWGGRLLTRSIRSAAREQGLAELMETLGGVCPDLSEHYTTWTIASEYFTTKVRAQHAFQVALAKRALDRMAGGLVIDLGDSAGTHTRYLQHLYPDGRFTFLSVNLDGAAVEKITAKGLQATCERVEVLAQRGLRAEVMLAFELLEHLSDPIRVLHDLSEHRACQALVVTVPYLTRSRMGLHHIRQRLMAVPVNAERTHLFELSPADWRLLFVHAGWRVEEEQVYRQYPRWSLWRLTKPIWRARDFEGFYGAILVPDATWSSRYTSW